ncbi:hypothetical protein [Terriglobus saanensis]|uniref:Adenylate cyclase n=1 Tax=Terriglobus saanensis (strain ATCC BAA-1853 / DSM 23119 / SP1PR4) TaxID=401053 RepID=E8UZX4_TERSS|nr:hypothetical protein [Terriglobus saanensis]ADV81051.1 hypothetical protein AciPR4_0213 [Terriglobus saanensis SP1PR4]
MLSVSASYETLNTLDDPRAELTHRIVASSHLSGSPKLCEFFLYVVDCCLREAPEDATEQQIGVNVFHRIPGYNSSDDSIVRSQARLLRLKLTAYFAREGEHEPLVVEIPKGHYLPVFHPSEHHQSLSGSATEVIEPIILPPVSGHNDHLEAAALPTPATDSLETELHPGDHVVGIDARFTMQRKVFRRSMSALVALFLLAVGLMAGILLGRHRPTIRPTAVDRLWKPFLKSAEPALVIYSNPIFSGTPDEGLKLVQPDTPESQVAANRTLDETYTGTGEVVAAHILSKLFDQRGSDFVLKRSRLVTWDEAKLRNLIFMGAPRQNGALHDLPSTADFTINLNAQHTGYIANLHPRTGEPAAFIPSSPNEEFAIVAMIPGIDSGRRIAVFAGLTTNGTQAAVEFAASPHGAAALLDKAGEADGSAKPFEAVLHISLSRGVPLKADLIALHSH